MSRNAKTGSQVGISHALSEVGAESCSCSDGGLKSVQGALVSTHFSVS